MKHIYKVKVIVSQYSPLEVTVKDFAVEEAGEKYKLVKHGSYEREWIDTREIGYIYNYYPKYHMHIVAYYGWCLKEDIENFTQTLIIKVNDEVSERNKINQELYKNTFDT